MDLHFNVYGLPDQLHSDNGKEFVKTCKGNCSWSLWYNTQMLRCIIPLPIRCSSSIRHWQGCWGLKNQLGIHNSKQQYRCYTTFCHVWAQSNANCGLDVPYAFSRKKDGVSLVGEHDWREAEYERDARQKNTAECTDVQIFDTEHLSQICSVVLWSKSDPWYKSQAKIFLGWAVPCKQTDSPSQISSQYITLGRRS